MSKNSASSHQTCESDLPARDSIQLPTPTTEKESCDFHVVGVGASAGGLEALENFFKSMPTDLGVAFVVVQHLSPDFKSHMQQLLARQTAMPIFRVENNMEAQPNSIYLIPPNKEMIISKRRLLLTDRDPKKAFSHPIDQFFRSIANDQGRYGVGVILSGTGSDGSRGVKDIHDAGGLVLCQDEETASFDGMPLNAQETGVVDLVLPPEAMAEALGRYVHDALSPDMLAAQEIAPSQLAGIERVFELLRSRFSLDFSSYKSTTVARRVKRRMAICQIIEFEDYVANLERNGEELDWLYRDLLIGVTRFFRDDEAFTRLEQEVIPDLLQRATADEPLRVWVAGCATGEEAYSLAILLSEAIASADQSLQVKVFATDVHRVSLEIAGKGIYPDSSLEEVSENRRERFFTKHADGWQVIPELRKMIVFAQHNLIQDAPFTQIDLVSCRNLLIYFQPTAQKKALSFFHFSLKAGGTLLLGPSESTGDLADEFSTIDKRWKVFRKRRDVRLPADIRADFSSGPTRFTRAALGSKTAGTRGLDSQLLSTYDRLLDLKMPPSFLVDESGELIHTFGGAERLLSIRSGRTSTNLLDLIDPELKTSLSAAMQHAIRESDEVRYTGLNRFLSDGQSERMRLTVNPIIDTKTSVVNLLVELEQVTSGLPLPVAEVVADTVEQSGVDVNPRDIVVDLNQLTEQRVVTLENELRTTQENLQAAVEELETSNEELQASNEELVASNEELQSTNEELHSVNEELYTVNAEHQRKIDELTEVTDDLDNLLASTDVGVIFLDEDLCVRRFTPQIAEVFNLLPQDIGRRIDTFSSKLEHGGLIDDLRAVRDGATTIEREVNDQAGRHVLMRVLPYNSPASPTRGILLTLIDIENLREAEKNVLESEQRFRMLLDSTAEGVLGIDREGICTFVNRACLELLGCQDEQEILGESIRPLFNEHTSANSKADDVCQPLATGQAVHSDRCQLLRIDGSEIPIEYWSHPVQQHQELAGGVVTFFDVSERRRSNEQLREARVAAESANRAKSRFLANMSHELRTPLSAILGFAEILLAELTNEQHCERVTTIRTNGAYLLELLNDILDLSKIEAGKLSISPEATDLTKLLSDVVKLMRVRAEAKELPLHFSLLTAVPRYLYTDPRRLRQVLVNLVGNAIKFTDQGEINLTAHVPDRQDQSACQLILEVRDTGVGIDSKDLNRIFKPFSQVDQEDSKATEGTGLGLSISRLLARELGGEINVESVPGIGSRFVLSLPVQTMAGSDAHEWVEPEELLQALPIQVSEQPTTRTAEALAGKRILIADDRRDIRHVADYFLRRSGAETLQAEDGRQAVSLIREQIEAGSPIELVLMDMQMPNLNGYEATRQLIDQGCNAPIIALTAAAMKGERDRCLEAGCRDYLTKPIDGDTLVAVCVANLVET